MRRGSVLFAVLLMVGFSLPALAQEQYFDPVEGTFRQVNGVPVIDADRVYSVTGLTVFVDGEGKLVPASSIPPGRGVILLSATAGTSGVRPIALRAEVMAPH